MYFYEMVNKNQYLLNQTEQKLLSYFIIKKDNVRQITIKQAANDNYIAQNTIVRFTKKLGFSGYSEFKEMLFLSTVQTPVKDDDWDITEHILKTEELVNAKLISTIVSLMHKSNRILVLAVGLSRISCNDLNERLQMIGINSQSYVDPHFMRYNCAMLNKNDLVFAFSVSGETKTILEAVNIAALNGANTVSITGISNNSLSNITRYQIYAHTTKKVIKGIDVADRLSFSYIANRLFTEFVQNDLMQ